MEIQKKKKKPRTNEELFHDAEKDEVRKESTGEIAKAPTKQLTKNITPKDVTTDLAENLENIDINDVDDFRHKGDNEGQFKRFLKEKAQHNHAKIAERIKNTIANQKLQREKVYDERRSLDIKGGLDKLNSPVHPTTDFLDETLNSLNETDISGLDVFVHYKGNKGKRFERMLKEQEAVQQKVNTKSIDEIMFSSKVEIMPARPTVSSERSSLIMESTPGAHYQNDFKNLRCSGGSNQASNEAENDQSFRKNKIVTSLPSRCYTETDTPDNLSGNSRKLNKKSRSCKNKRSNSKANITPQSINETFFDKGNEAEEVTVNPLQNFSKLFD